METEDDDDEDVSLASLAHKPLTATELDLAYHNRTMLRERRGQQQQQQQRLAAAAAAGE